jgi:hypothetical protein
MNYLLETIHAFPQYNKLVESFASRIKVRNNANQILEIATSRETPNATPNKCKASNEHIPCEHSLYSLDEVCYNLYYVERNHHERGCPWSLRELAVYHTFNLRSMASCWIFIQTGQAACKFWNQTHDAAGSEPLDLHVLLLRFMLTQWTQFIDYWDAKIESLVVFDMYQFLSSVC